MAGEGKHLIALFQAAATNEEPTCNIPRMKEQIQKASVLGAEMIVFPELFLTGYHRSETEIASLAELKEGYAFQQLSLAAKEEGIAVVYGYPEVDHTSGKSLYYNSAQMIDKNGRSVMNYRKVHLWLYNGYEAPFTPGDQFTVVECCGMKVGLLICYDTEFPESVRSLALKGAQLVLAPSAATGIVSNIMHHVTACRAAENGIYMAPVNYAKSTFCGRTMCCDPRGDIVVAAGLEETLLLASIDVNLKPQWSYLAHRRPTTYQDILA